MNLKGLAAGAGQVAAAAQRKAELTKLETITLPAVYHKIGEWIAGHEKLPPDLAALRDEIRAIEAQQAAPRQKPDASAVGVAGLAKQLAAKTAQAANDAAASLKVRNAYVSLGSYASGKYGDKAVPADILPTFRETLARVTELRGASAIKPAAPAPQPRHSLPPAMAAVPAVAVTPPPKRTPPRVCTNRQSKSWVGKLLLPIAVVAMLVTGGVIASRTPYLRERVWAGKAAAGTQLRVNGQEPTSEEWASNKSVAELVEAGNLDEATKLAERQLKQVQKRTIQGAGTWDKMAQLAGLYLEQKKYAPAIPLYEKAIEGYESAQGKNSEDIAQCLAGLAHAYEQLRRYPEAKEVLDRRIAVCEAMHGKKDPRVAHCLNALAGLFEKQGKFAEAEQAVQRSLNIVAEAYRADHPDAAVFTGNLGGIYEKQKKYDKAEECYLRAIDIYESTVGPKHPFTAMGLNNLARLYKKQALYEKAEPLMVRALAICEESQGPDHPDTKGWRKALAEVQEEIANK